MLELAQAPDGMSANSKRLNKHLFTQLVKSIDGLPAARGEEAGRLLRELRSQTNMGNGVQGERRSRKKNDQPSTRVAL